MPRATKLRFEGDNRTKSTFRELDRSMNNIGSRVTRMGLGLKGMVRGFVALKAVQYARTALNDATALRELSRQLNVSTENLSTYSAVARDAGITNQTFATGVQRMRRRASEATEGNLQLARAFKQLDIDATKFKNLNLEDQLLVMADRFQNTVDSTDAQNRAMKILDTEGVTFLRFLTLGSEALKKTADDTRVYAEVTDEAAASAQRFNSSIEQYTTTLKSGGIAVFNWVDSLARWVIDQKKLQLGLSETNVEVKDMSTSFGVLQRDVNNFNVATDTFTNQAGLARTALQKLNDELRQTPSEAAAAVGRPLADVEQDLRLVNIQMKNFELGLTGFEGIKIDPFADTDEADLEDRVALPIERAIRAGGREGAKGMGRSIIDEMQSNVIRQLAKLLSEGLGSGKGGGFGGFIASIFGGSRAAGGSVEAGKVYRTHGLGSREFFTPGADGAITVGGGGGGNVFNIDARGADAGVEARIRRGVEEAVAAGQAKQLDLRDRRR